LSHHLTLTARARAGQLSKNVEKIWCAVFWEVGITAALRPVRR